MKRQLRQSGQSLVESALVLSAFMGLLVGMIGVGQSLFIRQTLADRAHTAARWGALHTYDPAAIRRVALYGSETPAPNETAFFSLTAAAIDVSNPGCPGPQCRITVAIPDQGIRSVEPAESPAAAITSPDLVASQP